MPRHLLAAKAEVVLGAQLVLRHRTPRLAGLLALAIVVLSLMRDHDTAARAECSATVILIAGTLAAVAGSRLLAPGAALAASRRVAAPWWLVPTGRLSGGMLVILPVVFVTVLGVGAPRSELLRLGAVAGVYAVAAASLVLALAPVFGASAAATVGFLGAWAGFLPPSGIHAALEGWPAIQGPLVMLWNLLPLSWRAGRWFLAGNSTDVLTLSCWILVGIVAAAWVSMSVCPSDRIPSGGVA